ncbi:response regulator [Niabella sp. CJ426]|uniref:response regulator transcription factor n=1 Tax=Niabella sp. CJ426 TaxID=3393740 RepID=UPI003D07B79A
MTEDILIIDDEPDVLDFLSMVLGYSYGVHQASDARLAQNFLETKMIHLIISDIMMPEMDGYELCRFIKSSVEYCHIPVILLTSRNTHATHIDSLQVGADAYIRKPFSVELLLLQVKNLLKNRQKIREHLASTPFTKIQVLSISKKDDLFQKRLKKYVDQHIENPEIDLDDIAEHLCMSRTTLYRKITDLLSLKPKEFVDFTRLKRATELMIDNTVSLEEIPRRVGYSSEQLFNRSFEKYFNMSASEYHLSIQKDNRQNNA